MAVRPRDGLWCAHAEILMGWGRNGYVTPTASWPVYCGREETPHRHPLPPAGAAAHVSPPSPDVPRRVRCPRHSLTLEDPLCCRPHCEATNGGASQSRERVDR